MVRLTDLINQGAVLEKKDLSDKGRLNFRSILTPQTTCEVHPSEDIRPLSKKKQKQGLLLYKEMCRFIRDLNQKVARNDEVDVQQGFDLIAKAIDPPETIQFLYHWALYPWKGTDFLILKPVNVCILSLTIGKGLAYSKQQQLELGIAAILFDIGMGKIPQEILHKQDSFTAQELEDIRKHPLYGYEKILSLGENYKWLADIIHQSHEREDGSGYSQGLKEKEIHEYAKIIGLADTFEALTHYRPYRRPSQAVKEIIGSQKHLFSPHILKVFIQEITIFPIYSYVKLNSGVIGRVITTSKQNPLRPTIEILFDAQGKKINEYKVIRLRDTPLLHIVAPADEQEDNQYAANRQWQEGKKTSALEVQ